MEDVLRCSVCAPKALSWDLTGRSAMMSTSVPLVIEWISVFHQYLRIYTHTRTCVKDNLLRQRQLPPFVREHPRFPSLRLCPRIFSQRAGCLTSTSSSSASSSLSTSSLWSIIKIIPFLSLRHHHCFHKFWVQGDCEDTDECTNGELSCSHQCINTGWHWSKR